MATRKRKRQMVLADPAAIMLETKTKPEFFPVSALADHLRESPYQTRSTPFDPDDEADRALAMSILEKGIIQPVGLHRDNDDFFVLWGHRRLAASIWLLRNHGKDVLVPAMVYAENSATLTIVENYHRKDLHVVEKALSIKRMVDNGIPRDEILALTGLSQASFYFLIQIAEAPSSLREEMLRAKIGIVYAAKLAALAKENEAAAMEAARRLASGDSWSEVMEEEKKPVKITSIPQPTGNASGDSAAAAAAVSQAPPQSEARERGTSLSPSPAAREGVGWPTPEMPSAAPEEGFAEPNVSRETHAYLSSEAWPEVLLEAGVAEEDLTLAMCDLTRQGALLPRSALEDWAAGWLNIPPEKREVIRAAFNTLNELPVEYRAYVVPCERGETS